MKNNPYKEQELIAKEYSNLTKKLKNKVDLDYTAYITLGLSIAILYDTIGIERTNQEIDT
jgi:hypothetical protein